MMEENQRQESSCSIEEKQIYDLEDKEGHVEQFLQFLSKEELIDFVKSNAMKNPLLMENIVNLMDIQHYTRKVYISGLSWHTTVQTVHHIFSIYGEVEDCSLVMDEYLKIPKGCANITYRDKDSVQKALKSPLKVIDRQITECHMGALLPELKETDMVPQPERVVYVGGVPSNMAAERLVQEFSTYAEIEQGPLGYYKMPGKFNGIVAFIYKNAEDAKRVVQEKKKVIDGKTLFCSNCEDSEMLAGSFIEEEESLAIYESNPIHCQDNELFMNPAPQHIASTSNPKYNSLSPLDI